MRLPDQKAVALVTPHYERLTPVQSDCIESPRRRSKSVSTPNMGDELAPNIPPPPTNKRKSVAFQRTATVTPLAPFHFGVDTVTPTERSGTAVEQPEHQWFNQDSPQYLVSKTPSVEGKDK